MWKAISDFLLSLVKTPLAYMVGFFAGKQSGRKDAEIEQYKQSLQDIADAEAARRKLSDDTNSVQHDPFNRDNA